MKRLSTRNSQLSTFNSQFSSSAGFTLIELIVVISVTAVISVIGIASFVSYNQTQSLNTTAADIANMFSLAKSRAASGAKPNACSSQTLNGYQITINISGTYAGTYELNAICSPVTSLILRNKLPNPIIFSSADPTTYLFQVLTGGLSANGARTIVLSGFGKTKSITVDSLGNAK